MFYSATKAEKKISASVKTTWYTQMKLLNR